MVESTVGEPFVDADDLADVAVATLLEPVHVGRIHELTGPRLITFRDVAAEIGSASGRPVAYRQLPVQDYVATLVSAGPREEATGLAYLFTEVLDGRNARLESGVKDVLGREPRDFTAFAGARWTPKPTMNDVLITAEVFSATLDLTGLTSLPRIRVRPRSGARGRPSIGAGRSVGGDGLGGTSSRGLRGGLPDPRHRGRGRGRHAGGLVAGRRHRQVRGPGPAGPGW